MIMNSFRTSLVHELIYSYHSLTLMFILLSTAYHGNVEFMDGSKRDEFLTFVNNVNVADGDDCDELAISGIRAVYGFGVEEGSPIYVLTDAGAKDASEDNLLALEIMAFESRTPINFFLSNAGREISFCPCCYLCKNNGVAMAIKERGGA